jgi:hypothetical protein
MCQFPRSTGVSTNGAAAAASPETSSSSASLKQQQSSYKVINDTNISKALEEEWDVSSVLSPGFEPELKATFQKTKGSALQDLVRAPRTLYENFAFLFMRDSRDVPIFNVALLATCEYRDFDLASCAVVG